MNSVCTLNCTVTELAELLFQIQIDKIKWDAKVIG